MYKRYFKYGQFIEDVVIIWSQLSIIDKISYNVAELSDKQSTYRIYICLTCTCSNFVGVYFLQAYVYCRHTFVYTDVLWGMSFFRYKSFVSICLLQAYIFSRCTYFVDMSFVGIPILEVYIFSRHISHRWHPSFDFS